MMPTSSCVLFRRAVRPPFNSDNCNGYTPYTPRADAPDGKFGCKPTNAAVRPLDLIVNEPGEKDGTIEMLYSTTDRPSDRKASCHRSAHRL
jgi:hypothetical protein